MNKLQKFYPQIFSPCSRIPNTRSQTLNTQIPREKKTSNRELLKKIERNDFGQV